MLVFAGTVLNQTGQPLEVMIITMASYVLIGLAIGDGRSICSTAASNWWSGNWRKLRAFLRSCVATPLNIVLSVLTLLLAWLAAARPCSSGRYRCRLERKFGSRLRGSSTPPAGCSSSLRFKQILLRPLSGVERWRVDLVACISALAIGLMLIPCAPPARAS